MMVMNLRPATQAEDRGMRLLAHFDAQITPDIRMYNLRLLETADGNRCVYAAQAGPRRSATFAMSLAMKLTEAASAALTEAITAHDISICLQ